jgi:hypothetical protein
MAGQTKRDLNDLSHREDYDTKVVLQRRESETDALYRRRKDLVAFTAVIIGMGLVGLLAAAVVLIPGLAPESKGWATSALSAIIAGGVGYLSGKSSSSS